MTVNEGKDASTLRQARILPEYETVGERELSEAVHQALGFASVCWEPMDCTGTFDEARVRQAADELTGIIGQYAAAVAAQGRPAPGDAGVTSETVARAAYHVMWTASGVDVRWEDLDPQDRHVWARIALAAIDAWGAQPQPAPELAAAMREARGYREGIARLRGELESSAAMTHPSKKSEVELHVIAVLSAVLSGKPGRYL